MKYYFIAILTLVSQFAFSQTNIPTQTIKGQIIDEQSGNFVSGAVVQLKTIAGATTQSNDNGLFQFKNVTIGRHTLTVTHINYEDATVQNVELTSSKELVLEIKIKERVKKLEEITVRAGRSKLKALNENALISARQLSIDEAFRYSGTRSDPSRMAQNFAGVSGGNDARNDIIIRGNSPTGVLWRMDGIDIPNPNHFSTLGATGGPVSILNINTLKNSDFLTSAFPAQYGNAVAGVFDLRMRNGNADKTEFLGQMGFNGFELGVEGPISKINKSSFLLNYRYSMLAPLQSIGLKFGTGSATPYYQDATFKVNVPTKKIGTFSFFGLGGESHITFLPTEDDDNLYQSTDGSPRERNFKSLTGVVGATHSYFYNKNTSSKTTVALSGFKSNYNEDIVKNNNANKLAFQRNNLQTKTTIGHTFNKKINAKNQITFGATIDFTRLQLTQNYIPRGDSILQNLLDTDENLSLTKLFANYNYRVTTKLTTNIGAYFQHFGLNNSKSIEPRWNMKYQISPRHAITAGAGMHSQLQPLEIYFYKIGSGPLTNKNLGFTKSNHFVIGYDFNITNNMRLKTEAYYQQLSNIPIEQIQSSFSLLNAGADFGFPDKTNLINKGTGYNKGVEFTIERFLQKGFYFLTTVSLFESKYKGSDNILRNTAFNSNYVINSLAGKEWKINVKNSIGLDSKITYTGGQRYTPFDIAASQVSGFTLYKEQEAFSLQNPAYFRWDIKFSYIQNGNKTTQKWYIDLQNASNQKNIYVRNLNPTTGKVSNIYQIGFFPNINYQITF